MQNHTQSSSILNITVVVAALGYFVDIYDLLLFGIIRIPSLKDMGHSRSDHCRWRKHSFLANVRVNAGWNFMGYYWYRKGRSSVLLALYYCIH